jgi:tetratricopeptide (TPR) repeat protein
MSTLPNPAPSASSAGDDRNLVQVDETYPALSFEDRLHLFWTKNSKIILVGCVIIVTAILAKGAYDFLSARREKSIAADYAVATSDAQLKAFAAAHPTHTLGGLARLRLADEAYAAGRYADAHTAYTDATAALKATLFAPRARLGAAISLVLSGLEPAGTAALKTILSDVTLPAAARAEAAYTLASLALEAGRTDEAAKLIEQLLAIYPAGQWAQGAMSLRSRLPVSATAAITPPAAGVSFQPTP